MKQRTLFLFMLAVFLSSSMTILSCPVEAESADSVSFPSGIVLYSPVNVTYDSRYLFLNLTLYSAGSMGSLDSQVSMKYSVDGIYNGSVPMEVANPGLHIVTNGAAFVSLPKLSEGSHCLTLYLYGHNQRSYDPKYLSYVDTVYFSVSVGASDVSPPGWEAPEVTPQVVSPKDLTPPKISILSPTKNQTYETVNITSLSVPLDFTVDEASQLKFSMDGQQNRTVDGNSSLVELSAGQHNVTVFALDSAGNVGVSETVDFVVTVVLTQPQSEPSLILPIAVSVASIVVVAASASVYVKKRK